MVPRVPTIRASSVNLRETGSKVLKDREKGEAVVGKVVMVVTLIAAALGFQNVPATPQRSPVQTPSDSTKVLNALNDLQKDVAALKVHNGLRDFLPSAVALFAIIVSLIVSVVSLNRNAQLTRETLQSKAYEEERKAIREKRDRFYGPFIQLRGVSHQLYDAFNSRRTPEERAQYADKDGKYRTLIALCGGHDFSGVDKTLLDEMVGIGEESERLIMKEIGLVDDATLQEGLTRAAVHYRLIRRGVKGELKGAGAEIDGFTFPHEVDELIHKKIRELDARLRELESIAMRGPKAKPGQ
jgi:hypothetical protein